MPSLPKDSSRAGSTSSGAWKLFQSFDVSQIWSRGTPLSWIALPTSSSFYGALLSTVRQWVTGVARTL